MNKLMYPIIGLGISIAMWSCTKDNVQDEFGECLPGQSTYASCISPLFSSNNCLSCHGSVNPAANIDLTTYEGVKAVAENGRLVGALEHNSGFSPMPPSGVKINTEDIDKIKKWIENGSQNN